MKKLILFYIFLFSLNNIFSQVYLSNNTMMSVTDRAMMSVRGDIINRSEGFIYNTDTINLIGNWQNENSAYACDSNYQGIVRFTGNNQELRGSYPTNFYYLSLENTGIKSALINQYAYGKLLLNDRELAVNTHTIFVKNQNINAVNNTTGFVSSTEDGGLQREMNQIGAYVFPLGSSTSGILYRPLIINTKDNLYQVYKSGLTLKDATLDGFDRDIKERYICIINNIYYHRIYKNTFTNPVDIDFYFEPTDGNFNNISHWDNTSIWQKADTSIQSTSGIFLVNSIKDWNDFDDKAFTLSYTTLPFGLAGNDTSIYLGASIQLNTDASSIVTWSPDYNLSCSACPNPIASPDTTMFYYVSSERQDACKNIDTIKITVIPNLDNIDLFIPNTITPNADGYNDTWIIRALDQFPNNEVIILNRWGDQIFSKKPYDNSFDGKLWGQDLPEGTYYYLIKIKVDSDTKTLDGPLTIIK